MARPAAPRRPAALALVALALLGPGPRAAAQGLADGAGGVWVHRNLGAAFLDEDRFAEALPELARAAAIAPSSAGDARNHGIAALLAGDLEAARNALTEAKRLAPADAGTAYALGIVEKRAGRTAEALAELGRCRELGGAGPELEYNLGILATRVADSAAARREFAAVVARGKDGAPRHYASALYREGRALLAAGDRTAGADALRRSRDLVESGEGAHPAEEDLERGDLLKLTPFPRPPGVRAAGPLPAFALSPLPVGDLRWAHAADLDGDGDTDLLLGDGQTLRDLRRDGAAWADVTASRGLAGLLGVAAARAVDVDNDGAVDLVRGGAGGLEIQSGALGAWNPPRSAGVESLTRFVPVDFDHEGDVDFATAGPRRPSLLQNLGDGSFADLSESSGLAAIGPTVTVDAGDFDDDHDVDLVFVTRRGDVVVAANARGGRFDVRPPLAGAPAGAFEAAGGDLDADGDLDLVIAAPRGVFVLRNEGGLAFAPAREPALAGTVRWPAPGASSLWIADLDCDGHLDVLAATETGGLLGLGAGDGALLPAPEPLAPLTACGAFPVGVALLDADAKPDLVLSRGSCGEARNVGRTGLGLVLRLAGTRNNRDGVGTVVELLAGPRYARRDATGGLVHLGLGETPRLDALRVCWPDGIRQGVLGAKPGAAVTVEEKAGLVGSFPFLYAWNGERFDFVTDILTVAALGLPLAPGMYVPADRDETIRIEGKDLVPDAAGNLVLQVTEELRGVTYLDQVRLYAIDHPESVEVQPNEKFKFPPFPEFGVHVLDGARPPVRARDHRGRDVADRLVATDDLVVGDLPLTRYQGICAPHVLELDFGAVPADAKLTLHLAGWTDRTNASSNLAIAQDPGADFVPPQLEVARPDGSWAPWPAEVGFPGGKTKSIPVDLTGAFPGGGARVRISTTLRLYWDRALLQVDESPVTPAVTMILPDAADLHWRGHSEPIPSVSGEEPVRLDHDVPRRLEVPWDPHPGLYTRHGDVTPLLAEADDMYAILATGDECTVSFRADRLPPLPSGHARTYFVVFDGWAKDGDPNTAHSTQVEPLPFHGMSGYPYRADEAYPDDPAHAAYRAEWNTRRAERLTRDLAAAVP